MRLKVMLAGALLAATPLSQSWAFVSNSSMHAIAAVFANAEYAPKLKTVQFFFADQPHPAVATNFGQAKVLRRANSFGAAAPEAACQRAFASALIGLTEAAQKKGGDAVINIHSAFGPKDSASTTDYVCGTGAIVTGMTLYGDVVKLQ
jgi:hypothetical protein